MEVILGVEEDKETRKKVLKADRDETIGLKCSTGLYVLMERYLKRNGCPLWDTSKLNPKDKPREPSKDRLKAICKSKKCTYYMPKRNLCGIWMATRSRGQETEVLPD